MSGEQLIQVETNVSAASTLASLEIMVRQGAGLPISNLVLNLIMDIAQEIPENVNTITPSYAEYLAGRFLKGLELCGDLMAISAGHEMKMDSLKKKEYNTALLIRSRIHNLKTVVEKQAYAFTDELYLEAENRSNEAKMFRILVSEKHDMFKKAHYHMRKIAEKDPDMGYDSSTNSNNSSNSSSVGDDWTEFTRDK